MRQCVRCGNPMCTVGASEFECPTCGLVQITSYERTGNEKAVVVPDDLDEHGTYLGIGSLYPSMPTEVD